MEIFVLYIGLGLALAALFLCYYAHVRIYKMQQATKELDWSALANITGDLSTLKKTIQTLNNRINGMHSPKVADEEIMRYMANQRVANIQQQDNKIVGG